MLHYLRIATSNYTIQPISNLDSPRRHNDGDNGNPNAMQPLADAGRNHPTNPRRCHTIAGLDNRFQAQQRTKCCSPQTDQNTIPLLDISDEREDGMEL